MHPNVCFDARERAAYKCTRPHSRGVPGGFFFELVLLQQCARLHRAPSTFRLFLVGRRKPPHVGRPRSTSVGRIETPSPSLPSHQHARLRLRPAGRNPSWRVPSGLQSRRIICIRPRWMQAIGDRPVLSHPVGMRAVQDCTAAGRTPRLRVGPHEAGPPQARRHFTFGVGRELSRGFCLSSPRSHLLRPLSDSGMLAHLSPTPVLGEGT